MAGVAERFRSGRIAEAKAMLERMTASGRPDPQHLLLLAMASERLDDRPACAAALDRMLALDPRIVLGWLIKGDLALRNADDGGARSAYERAFVEARMQGNLPNDVRERLSRAAHWLSAGRDRQTRKFREAMDASGVRDTVASHRFRQSLDIIFENKEIYVSRPNVYFFPGLPQRQFYEREELGWAGELEARTDAIAAELAALLEERQLFTPHIRADDATPSDGYQGLAGNSGWSSLYLWTGGAPIEENARRCPETMAALEKLPLPHFSKKHPSAPAVMFSMLKSGARIPAHTGSTNVRLICHLPLVVPPKCAIRVGNEVRSWERGKLLVFDDTIEHEAWNESDEDRIVLIFDIWRPELTEEERHAVTVFFQCLEGARG